MKIQENDIDSIEPFGMMDGKTVNLLRTKGGLNLATMDDQVLGAASHQAILCYTIEQRFPNFQPKLMKSEGVKLNADSHSHFLSDDLRKSGHDIYSIQDGIGIDFFVTRQDIKIGCAKAVVIGDLLLVKSIDVSKEFVGGLSGAVSEKALSSGLKGVRIK
jgi:hypothetical protein